jgi:hypothetical protein
MIRSPLCLYDVDVAVDGDAFIITIAERRRQVRQSSHSLAGEPWAESAPV